jgi:hypothetical protein
MKKKYKYLLTIALNGLLCLFVAFTADAQHRDGGGGGGGGSRSSGGGGGGGSRPSGGGGNVSRPSSPSVSRPSGGAFRPGGNQRVSVAPPRVNSQGIRPAYGAAQGYRGGAYGNPNVRNSVIGTRGYVGAGGRASVGVGGRGFVTGGAASWRTNGYYHYNHGYYGTYYAPRIGFSIGFLPYGYYPFYWNDYQYFYSGGLYYQYAENEYTVVEPPVGAEVTTLPSNAQSIVINGEQYYESNGVYYEPITKDDGTTSYQIAGKDGQLNTNGGNNNDVQQTPQVGDIVQSLPPDCRKINLNGQKYYVSADGYYYQETVDQNNNKAYKIVGTPEDGPGN